MYLILARLLLGALKDPIEQSPSALQAGGKRGKTPAQHALAMLTRLHAKDDEEAYVCLIESQSIPEHAAPGQNVRLASNWDTTTPHRNDKDIYHRRTLQYGSFVYSLERGVKEGCPLSPSLFVLVYEAFHHTLDTEFPELDVYVYMDDIAIMANNLT